MHVLVTGAEGFVGRHLVARLRGAGFGVSGTDRELDVIDAPAVARAVAQLAPDAIVHLAAQSSVAASRRTPLETWRTNFLGSRSVLEAAAASRRGVRVLLAGSAEQYGPARPGDPPFSERSPLRPGSPYARSKAAADLLGACFARRGLAVVRVRAFSHTGPGQSDAFALSSFARQLAEIAAGRREPVLRVGNLDSARDFLDIDDVTDAYLRLLDPDVAPGAYNVASGSALPLRHHLETLVALAGVSPAIEVDPGRLRPADASAGDSARLRAATGWRPLTPLRVTLARLLEDWRARVSAP